MRMGLAGLAVAGGLGLTSLPVAAVPVPPLPPAPAAATPVTPVAIERIRYEEARRVLIIEGARRPQLATRLLRSPDRLEVELPGCVLLRPDLQVAGTLGKILRKARVMPGAIAGGGVRLVLDLVPGTVGSVAVRHEPRRVILALGAPAAASGEAPLDGRSALASPSAPVAQESSSPEWVEELDQQAGVRRLDRIWHWPRVLGAGSTFEVRWHQLDDVEQDAFLREPVFGTSTGLRDVRWRHWLWPAVGFGLRGTYVVHDLVYEDLRFSRSDWMLVPDLAARAIVGPCELEIRGGYVVRDVRTTGDRLPDPSRQLPAAGPGTFPVDPPSLSSAFMQGTTVGFTCRTRLTSALAFDAGIDWAPSLVDASRAGFLDRFPVSRTDWFAGFVVDVEPLTFRIGWEEAISRGRPAAALYRQTLSGLHVGLGIRY